METKAHILAVDDDATVLQLLRRLLESAGYSVDIASDGSSALAMLDQHPPDLIILDIMMPVLDGFQVLSLIRERTDIPVIMVTGVQESVSAEKALGIGADDYIRKPFHLDELLARVQAKLRRARPKH